MSLTHRERMVLAALASGGPNTDFAPVQVQKLFFLIDNNIAADVSGPLFSFRPYDYGPFDSAVYSELEHLRRAGYVHIEASPGSDRRRFSLTPTGYDQGRQALGGLSQRARNYMNSVTEWMRGLSFAELVGAIYNKYPEMRENSVFRD